MNESKSGLSNFLPPFFSVSAMMLHLIAQIYIRQPHGYGMGPETAFRGYGVLLIVALLWIISGVFTTVSIFMKENPWSILSSAMLLLVSPPLLLA
ncbi:MAG: hypothetical protein ACPGN3_18200 [Opitutales bacterium]